MNNKLSNDHIFLTSQKFILVVLAFKNQPMKKTFLLFVTIAFIFSSYAQSIIQRDAEIEQMVKEVSPDSLQSYIKSLVAFETRNTLSTQSNSSRGIGAARNWV